MRTIISICLLFVAMTLTHCTKDQLSEDCNDLRIVASSLNVAAPGGDASITYEAPSKVTATLDDPSTAEWCEITSVDAGKVNIKVKPNTHIEGRSAKIVLKNGNQSIPLILVQSGSVFSFDESQTLIYALNDGLTVPLNVVSTLPVEVEIPADAQSWVSYESDTPSKDQGKFVIKPNSSSHRGTQVTLTAGNNTVRYYITQYDKEALPGRYDGAAINIGNKPVALDSVVIEAVTPTLYSITNLFGLDLPIAAKFVNNHLRISSGQAVFEYNKFNLYLGIITQEITIDWSKTSSVDLVPIIDKNNRLIWAVVNNTTVNAWGLYLANFETKQTALEGYGSSLGTLGQVVLMKRE